ncbi:MAG: hypothetical protein JNM88_14330 [Chitinophagaceae bacterium]|nr:hypothetical protein [Chitinophagaceae bacterium]
MIHNIKHTVFRCSLAAALLILLHSGSYGQPVKVNEPDYNLPRLFSHVSDSVPVQLSVLTPLLVKRTGEQVTLTVGNHLLINGTVVSDTARYNQVIRTVVVRLALAEKALLVFSKVKVASGETLYRAHIVGKQTGDCFDLVQKDGQYYFVKRSIHSLRME